MGSGNSCGKLRVSELTCPHHMAVNSGARREAGTKQVRDECPS